MPKIYRAMIPDGDAPQVGSSSRTLGARVPQDIAPDANGDVHPGPAGMSVAPSLRDLPFRLVPKRLQHLREGAIGPSSSKVWRHGEGGFGASLVAPGLVLQPDRSDHGTVAPETTMSLSAYQDAIAATRSDWVVDEE